MPKDLSERGPLFRHNPEKLLERDIEIDVYWSESGMVMSVLDKRNAIVTGAWISVTMIL